MSYHRDRSQTTFRNRINKSPYLGHVVPQPIMPQPIIPQPYNSNLITVIQDRQIPSIYQELQLQQIKKINDYDNSSYIRTQAAIQQTLQYSSPYEKITKQQTSSPYDKIAQ